VSDLQFDNVDFALTSKRVVNHVNSDVDENSEFGGIISACRRLLLNNFHNSRVEFNKRQVNEVAHELAQTTPLNPSSLIIDDALSCICHILTRLNSSFRP